MGANLFNERFLSRREPAWHRLGKVFPENEKLTVSEAMSKADVLFKVDKYPQFVRMPDGTELETNSYAIVREPTSDDNNYKLLSTVGKEWTPIQATDLARMLDPISEKFPIETVGALGFGERIFLTLDGKETKIAGEDHHLYWLVSDSRDGTSGLTIAFTPVRVVCQNTLITGLRNSKVSVNIKHNKSINADVEFYLDIFRKMATTKEQVVNALNSLTKTTLVEEQISLIVNSAYPDASKPSRVRLSDSFNKIPVDLWETIKGEQEKHLEEYANRQKRIQTIREHAYERIDVFNQEFPRFAQSSYAIYQAIVETEDYRRGHDKSGTALFGSRADAKARAFNKALSFVN